MARMPLTDRLFRALLRLFPREFRGDFGEQMLDDFRDQHADAKLTGRSVRMWRLWMHTAGGALKQAPREHFDVIRRDAAYAVRLFRRRPATTLSALITLAAGIGLTAAVFSVMYGVLWRPLAFPDSERVVRVNEVSPPPEAELTSVSPANFLDFRESARSLDAAASVSWARLRIIRDTGAEEIEAAAVSLDFFRIVRPPVALGRLLESRDYGELEAQIAARDPNQPRPLLRPGVAVISHRIWVEQFGARPDVIGRRFDSGRTGMVEIVGVLQPGFIFPLSPDAECWLPDIPDYTQRRARYITVIGRLAAQATLPDAQAELAVIAARLGASYPEANKGRGAQVTQLRGDIARDVAPKLYLLGATAICVLLIVCANVSSLLLTQNSGRRHEFVTRLAVGATRAHLVRQALIEGLLLALAGGLLGMLLARWVVAWLISIAPADIPRVQEISIGPVTIAFVLLLSTIVGLLCSGSAIIASSRSQIATSLRTSPSASRSHGRRFRHVLIVSEVALAVALAVGAGLLVRTMTAVMALPLGFDPANVISVGLAPDIRGQDRSGIKAKYELETIEAVRALPGVVAAGIGSRPLGGGGMGTAIRLPEDPKTPIRIGVEAAGPGYLEALGARLLAGRQIEDRDVAGAPLVALVNEAASRRYFAGQAIGRTVLHDGKPTAVVGIVADVRRSGLEQEPEPTLYLPSLQTSTFWTNNMLVRTTGDPREMLPAIRTVVRQIDPTLPLTRVQTLEERLSESTAPRRFMLSLVGLFSTLALALAAVGVYGVLAEAVAQRIAEIGIRMALGASAGMVVRMILRQGGSIIAVGIAVGLGAALAANSVMSSFVFGVRTTDPAAYGMAAIAVVLPGLAACALPARRAARVDPARVLRTET
jgi:predicted permease